MQEADNEAGCVMIHYGNAIRTENSYIKKKIDAAAPVVRDDGCEGKEDVDMFSV